MDGIKYDLGKSQFTLVPMSIFSLIPEEWDEGVEDMYQELVLQYQMSSYHNVIVTSSRIASSVVAGYGRLGALRKLADLYGYGASRYGIDNWKGLDSARVVNALGRHIESRISGGGYDPETGFPQDIHILWNCITLNYLLGE